MPSDRLTLQCWHGRAVQIKGDAGTLCSSGARVALVRLQLGHAVGDTPAQGTEHRRTEPDAAPVARLLQLMEYFRL
ncbi:MAG TPA: hypothetical protein VFY10_01920 [Dehalococcoidia bacterium]|nr:hypothetical protein [Dehalococcoidia bacterium]